ncbi:MAG: hypothetical protein ACI9J3_003954 [Parvicellaceae bacterium]
MGETGIIFDKIFLKPKILNMRAYVLIATAFVVFLVGCNEDRGTVSLTYNKAVAVYGDIEQVRDTPLVVAPKSITDPGKIFMGDDFLLIGESGEGIHVFDNSNPNSPVAAAFIQLPFTNEFYVKGDFLYAESQYDFLKLDLSVLATPTMVDRVEYAFNEAIVNDEGKTLLGFEFEVVTEAFELNSPEAEALKDASYLYFDYMNNMIPPSSVPSSFAGNGTSDEGTLNKIAVIDHYAYVIGDNQLYTFNNSASDLELASSTPLSFAMETIYPEGNQLFIGTRNSMVIVDISSPSAPEYVSEYRHPTSCDPVFPFGSVAYLTLRTGDFSGCSGDENSLVVLDITDPTNPEAIVNLPMNSPYGMCAQNNHLFVGEGANGLTIFDINSPELPVQVVTHGDIVYDVMPHPTEPNRILTTGPNGLSQFEIDYGSSTATLVSSIAY